MVAHQAGIIGLSSGFRNIKNDLNWLTAHSSLNVRYEYLTKSDFAHVKSSLQKNIIDKKNLSKVRWDNLLSLCLY